MNWKDLAGPLAQAGLPTLGKIIGGLLPIPGGAIIGETLGRTIGSALGVAPTPDAIAREIERDPDGAAAKLEAVESAEAARWAALAEIAKADAQQAADINATIRAEIGAVSWWHWRHLNGYVVMLAGGGIVASGMTAVFTGFSAEFVLVLNALVAVYLGMAALNGYVARDTTQRTSAAAAGVPVQGIADAIAKAIKGGRK